MCISMRAIQAVPTSSKNMEKLLAIPDDVWVTLDCEKRPLPSLPSSAW